MCIITLFGRNTLKLAHVHVCTIVREDFVLKCKLNSAILSHFVNAYNTQSHVAAAQLLEFFEVIAK